MARERYESEDTGRNAFHEADEPWDGHSVVLTVGGRAVNYGQCRIRIVRPFWESESQRLDYLFAVEETRDMLPSERLEAIRRKFGGGEVKRMPRGHQTRRERDRELEKLREQIARDRVTGEA